MLQLMSFKNGIDQWETTYVTSVPVATSYKGKQTTCSSFFYILDEYTHTHWARFRSRFGWFLCLMAYQLFLGYLMPNPFS